MGGGGSKGSPTYYKNHWGCDINPPLTAFMTAVATVAAADGECSPAEREYIKGLMVEMGLNAPADPIANAAEKAVKNEGIDAAIAKCKATILKDAKNDYVEATTDPKLAAGRLVYACVSARFDVKERTALVALATAFGLDDRFVRDVESLVSKEESLKGERIRLCIPNHPQLTDEYKPFTLFGSSDAADEDGKRTATGHSPYFNKKVWGCDINPSPSVMASFMTAVATVAAGDGKVSAAEREYFKGLMGGMGVKKSIDSIANAAEATVKRLGIDKAIANCKASLEKEPDAKMAAGRLVYFCVSAAFCDGFDANERKAFQAFSDAFDLGDHFAKDVEHLVAKEEAAKVERIKLCTPNHPKLMDKYKVGQVKL